jgi:hypothetical protein
MDVIKKNLTIRLTWETNGMESLVCVVTEMWAHGSGYSHWSVIVTQNDQTSRAKYILPTRPLRCTEV